jgi:hypothetical protein
MTLVETDGGGAELPGNIQRVVNNSDLLRVDVSTDNYTRFVARGKLPGNATAAFVRVKIEQAQPTGTPCVGTIRVWKPMVNGGIVEANWTSHFRTEDTSGSGVWPG